MVDKANVEHLADAVMQLRQRWKKMNDYTASFATLWFEQKEHFDSGRYPGWTFAMWLGQRVGLPEASITKMLNIHNAALAHEHKVAAERVAAEQRQREREEAEAVKAQRAVDRQAREEAREAQRLARERIKEDEAKAKRSGRRRKAGAARKDPGTGRPAEQARWREENEQRAYVETHGAPGVLKALTNGLSLAQALDIVRGNETTPETQTAKLRELRRLSDDQTLVKWAARAIAALAKQKRGVKDWIDATMELADVLARARERIGSDNEFGDWLDRNKITIGKDDRAALIRIGQYPEVARGILARTQRHSLRLIDRYELQPVLSKMDDGFAAAAKPEATVEIEIPITIN
jgi:hypothetical protein